MARLRTRLVGLMAAAMATAGCGTVDYDTRVPQVTEFTVAPKEARYDQPRELEYRKPMPKREFKPGLAPEGAPGGMNGGGFNNGP